MTATRRAQITVENVARLERIATVAPGFFRDLDATPDGAALIVASAFGVHLWDAATLATLAFVPEPATRVRVGASGAIAVAQEDGLVRILSGDGALREQTAFLVAKQGAPHIAFAPDGGWLACGAGVGVELRDVVSGERGRRLPEMHAPVARLAWSPAGDRLAVGTEAGTVLVVDVTAGRIVASPLGHERSISALAFDWSGAHVISTGGHRDVVQIARADDGRVVGEIEIGPVWSPIDLTLIPDRMTLVCSTWREIRLFALPDRRSLGRILPGFEIDRVVASPDGARLFVAGVGRIQIRSATGELVRERRAFQSSDWISAVAMARAGDRAALGYEDGSITLAPLARDPQREPAIVVAEVSPHKERNVHRLTWSADDRFLAALGEDPLRVFWTDTGLAAVEPPDVARGVTAMAFHPDRPTLALALRGGEIALHRCDLDESEGMIRGAPEDVDDLAWSPDGTRLAAAQPGGVRLFSPAEGRLVGLVPVAASLRQPRIAWSPDGARLAVAGVARAFIWDVVRGERACELEGGGWAPQLAWSPDGSLIAGGPSVWATADGRRLLRVPERRPWRMPFFAGFVESDMLLLVEDDIELWGVEMR